MDILCLTVFFANGDWNVRGYMRGNACGNVKTH